MVLCVPLVGKPGRDPLSSAPVPSSIPILTGLDPWQSSTSIHNPTMEGASGPLWVMLRGGYHPLQGD